METMTAARNWICGTTVNRMGEVSVNRVEISLKTIYYLLLLIKENRMKRSLSLRLLLAFMAAALVLSACSQYQPQEKAALGPEPAEIRQAIEETNQRFAAAFNKADVGAVAQFYTEDAIMFPPNSDMARGREQIEAQLKKDIEQLGAKDLTLHTMDVQVSGDTAYEAGHYTITVQPPGAGPLQDEGKYLVVWKRQADESWKLQRDIWNTSKPQ